MVSCSVHESISIPTLIRIFNFALPLSGFYHDSYSNESGYPVEVAQSLVPVRNTLAFFELSSVSYHQVAEVLTRDRSRISISGWFHGPLKTKLVSKTMPFEPIVQQPNVSLEDMLNPDYLGKGAVDNICKVFLDQSSIELQKFLKPTVYDALVKELAAFGPSEGQGTESSLWDEKMGPSHVRSYSRVSSQNQDGIPTVLKQVQTLFGSALFESYLKKITNLSFLAVNTELRMFKKGDYTLLHDHALEKDGLDVTFSFPSLGAGQAEWGEDWGAGATHYVADKSNLLTLYPRANTLTIVLRDEGTLRFIRYLNSRVGEARRRELSMLFSVNDDDDDEEEDDEDDEEGGQQEEK